LFSQIKIDSHSIYPHILDKKRITHYVLKIPVSQCLLIPLSELPERLLLLLSSSSSSSSSSTTAAGICEVFAEKSQFEIIVFFICRKSGADSPGNSALAYQN
jgi:hypothetical protein